MRNFTIIFILLFTAVVSAQSSNGTAKLFNDYLKIKDALVTDNSAKASLAAENFVKTLNAGDFKSTSLEIINSMKKDAFAISSTKDIKTQRDSFYGLSDNMVELLKKQKLSTSEEAFVQYCPMAKGQWLSDKKDIKNPYYGKSMLECGYITEEIK